MKLKTKSIIAIVILVIITIGSTIVTAETGGNYSVGMALTSGSKLKAGDTVTITVKLTSVKAGNGIDTITAALQYDTNVFETLKSSNIIASNEWTPSYASQTNMLTVQKNDKVTAPETVLTINLKAKSEVTVNSTTITLKEIIVSGGRVADGGTGDIEVNNASVTISKEEATGTTNNTIVNTTGNTTATKNNTTIKDNTVTSIQKLPQTGIAQYGIISIVVVAIIGIFSYALYKKIAKDVK